MNDEEKQKNYELAQKLFSEQNLPAAVVAGAVATLLAAVAYGITVATWAFSYGFAAAGIGIFIGLSMGFLGRGIATRFGVIAALYTVAGCVLGNLFRVVMQIAQATATSPFDVLWQGPLSVLVDRAMSNISLVELVFWFVAVFCAVFFARRPLSRSERLAVGIYELRR